MAMQVGHKQFYICTIARIAVHRVILTIQINVASLYLKNKLKQNKTKQNTTNVNAKEMGDEMEYYEMTLGEANKTETLKCTSAEMIID